MNLKKRIEKLEENMPAQQTGKMHRIIVEPGQTTEQALEEFKAENEVGPDDDFWFIILVKPDPERFKHDTE